MAYAALASLAQTIDRILNHYQHSISLQEKQQITSLNDYVVALQAFLDEFPEKTNSLEGRIRALAYEAEDIIEYLMWEHVRSHYFESVKHPSMKSTNQLKKVTQRIDSIVAQVMQIMDDSADASSSSRAAPVHKDIMVGFDDDLIAIKSRLCGGSSKLQVVPIIGMRGIGKTILAKNASDDPLIIERFEIRAWVTVSQDYTLKEILLRLLVSMNVPKEEIIGQSTESMAVKVFKSLKGRRYLIVMDDMRSIKAWAVRHIFPDDSSGSRIMLTTRLSDVAAYPDPSSPLHEIHLMDENQSWNLFQMRLFSHEDCPTELEDIAKEIARSCRGLPLAIVVVAGLLSTISMNKASLGKIAESVNLALAAERELEEILNYTNLLHNLTLCLSYMRDFPEDDDEFIISVFTKLLAMIKYLVLVRNHPHQAQPGYHIHDLEKVTREIQTIAEQVEQVIKTNNSFRIKDKQQLFYSSAATSSLKLAPVHKDVMIGFDDDLMAIKNKLCGESSQLRVISILGMGGIGKTTLARNAYNDPFIMEYFHICAWVTISQNYCPQEILSSLLVSMEGLNAERSGQSNEEKVYKSLKGKRYLVVVDDIWSTSAWDEVRNIFPNDRNGSRIMLTTRISDVAAYPNFCSSICEMHFMDEDQSWNLLSQKVFAHQDYPLELENIGKEIARSCRGLPLAIVVIAGLLSTVSKTPASWREIAENVNSVVAAKHGQVEEILSLSYTQLPHHLRPCFLYIGGFPKDHEVRVSKLIKLWVAEGLLRHPNGSKSIEEEAEECLKDLVNRSLVLVSKRKSNGKIKSCSLHDLMRDLCIRKANEEKFLINIRDGYVEKGLLNPRRISIAVTGPVPSYLLRTYGSTIRTIMWFIYTSLPSLESFRLLKVLDAGDADIVLLPAQLFELFHLRYLAINYPRRIPAAISNLLNLQTLIILARGRSKLYAEHMDSLPQEIWRMPQLRHLLFYGTLPNPEGTTGTLETLQTLFFSLSDYTTEGILKMMPNLKKLEINCSYGSRICLNNLIHMHQLENLELRSYSIFGVWPKDDFTLPRTMKKLTLSYLRLSWSDMTYACSLPDLQVLKLKNYACRGSTWETTEGEFPRLEFLLIEKSDLEHWMTESSHFPRLKCLVLDDCRRLSEIPDAIGEISTMELIEVKGKAEKSLVDSAKRIQEEQQSVGNDALQVHCMTH